MDLPPWQIDHSGVKVLFLVSGASGAGKSTVREIVTSRLGEAFEAVELRDLGSLENITVSRRQELTEVAAKRAIALAEKGRHLLLSGDPVAPGELVAAPSATGVGGLAICILDANADAQTSRLRRRGDPEEHLPLHLGFAQWMREHAVDPAPRLDVLRLSGWAGMRWDRLGLLRPDDRRWKVRVIDTSGRSCESVAEDVMCWIKTALEDDNIVMRPEDWS